MAAALKTKSAPRVQQGANSKIVIVRDDLRVTKKSRVTQPAVIRRAVVPGDYWRAVAEMMWGELHGRPAPAALHFMRRRPEVAARRRADWWGGAWAIASRSPEQAAEFPTVGSA